MTSATSARHIILPAGLAVLFATFLVTTSVPLPTAIGISAVVSIQTWSGAFAWRLLARGTVSGVETLGMGLALGTSMAVVAGLASRTVGLGNSGSFLPALTLATVWLVMRVRGRMLASPPTGLNRATATALILGILVGIVGIGVNLTRYPLAWEGSWGGYHPDMLFFEALSTSLAQFGPLDSVFLADGVVRYHWVVYAWAGQVTEATGAGPFVMLTRGLPFVSTVMITLLAVAWTRRLTRVGWAPLLAVLLVLTGGYVGATYGTVMNFDSPSQAMTAGWLVALSVIFLRLLRPAMTTRRALVLSAAVVLLSFTTTGGKVSSGAVGIAALATVAAAGLILRAAWAGRALLAALAATFGGVLAYVLVIYGSADPGGLRLAQLLDRASSVQGLNPIPGALGIVAGTAILVVAIAPRGAGLLWLVSSPESRRSPTTLLGLGFALTAIATVILVSGGLNDTWFALAASAPLSVISAAGVARAAQSIGAANSRVIPRSVAWWSIAVGLAAAAVATGLWLTGGSGGNIWVSTWRWAGPIAAVALCLLAGAAIAHTPRLHGSFRSRWLAVVLLSLVVSALPSRMLGVAGSAFGVQSETGLSSEAFAGKVAFLDSLDSAAVTAWSDSQAAAATQLRDLTGEEDILATNVTFSPLVPALTGGRTFVSGIQYQAPYGPAAQLPALVEREELSMAFIDSPTDETARLLCQGGVRWLWIDPERTPTATWEPWATTVVAATDVIIARLDITC